MSEQVKVAVELTHDEAWALAQFVKRAGLSDYRGKAQSDDEAYLMRNAGDKLRQALADAGVAPR